MDPATIEALLSLTKSLEDVGKELGTLISHATETPDVANRVVRYLEVVQTAVYALGRERQLIIEEVDKCNVGNPQQVEALRTRLHKYLYEDYVRKNLMDAVAGLKGSHAELKSKVHFIWWSDPSTDRAVKKFDATLSGLESFLEGLKNNFYPGGSGMGIVTLVPLYQLMGEIRDAGRANLVSAAQLADYNKERSQLLKNALADPSHVAWLTYGAEVETRIAELRSAFDMRGPEK
jgi:hypothetical protein